MTLKDVCKCLSANVPLVLNFRPFEGGSRLVLGGPIFGMLAIGHPSNGKTTGELINLKIGYF